MSVKVSSPFDAAQASLCLADITSLKLHHLHTLREATGKAAVPNSGISLKDLPALFNEFTQYVQARQAPVFTHMEPKEPFLTDAISHVKKILDQELEAQEMKDLFLNFCKELTVDTTPAALSAAEDTIGKLLLVLDSNDVKKVAEDFKAAKDKSVWIKNEFEALLVAEKKQFDEKALVEKKIGFIDGDKYSAYELAKRFAFLIVTNTGFFNTKVVDELCSRFLKNKDSAAEAHMSQMLSSERLPLLHDLVDSTVIPDDDATAWDFIFETLDMPTDTVQLDCYPKIFHLTAQLSRLWDKKSETFHATTTGNLIKSLRPEHFAKDLNDWLNQGFFKRTISGAEKEYHFEIDGTPAAFAKEIKVRADGSLIHLDGWVRDKKSRLSDSEALSAAAITMGIDKYDVPARVQKAIASIATKEKAKEVTVTPDQLILELAESLPEEERESAIAAGKTALLAMATNLALFAWEQALVDMAAERAVTLTHAKVLSCVCATLYDQFKPGHVSEVELSESLSKAFMTKLNQKIEHVYDRAAHAFVMPKIDTPKAFSDFVIAVLDESAKEITDGLKPEDHDNQAALAMLVSRVSQFVSEPLFLQLALQKFDPKNTLDKLTFLPWRAPYGNNPFELMSTYAQEESQVTTVTAENAGALLQQFFAFANGNREKLSAPNTLFALARKEHAFTLKVTDPNFVKWVDAPAYFTETKALTFDRPLTEEERKKIALIAEEHLVNKEIVGDFAAQVAALKPELTLREYRDAIATIAGGNTGTAPAKTLRMLDSYITKEAMPADFMATIQPYIIRIAETNMFEGDKRLELCFYPDPISREMRLGMAVESTGALRRLNQQQWVINQSWTIDRTQVDAS